MDDDYYMMEALKAAQEAQMRGEVPVGAVIVSSETNQIVSVSGNATRAMNDPTAHAEILALRSACEQAASQRVPFCDLYVTLEPCTMCAAAIAFARIRRLVIGAPDMKGGAVMNGVRFFEQPTCHHKKIEIISGLLEKECAKILQDFFKERR